MDILAQAVEARLEGELVCKHHSSRYPYLRIGVGGFTIPENGISQTIIKEEPV